MSTEIVSKPKPTDVKRRMAPVVVERDKEDVLDLDFAALEAKASLQQTIHPGIRLRRAREVRGLHQKDVANWLKLDLNIIDALEKGEDQRLPGPVFIAGYIRSYAKLVELSPATLLEEYHRHINALPQKKESNIVPKFVSRPRGLDQLLKQWSFWEIFKEKDAQGKTVRYAALGVVMVVMMVVVVVIVGLRTDDTPPIVVVDNPMESIALPNADQPLTTDQTTRPLEIPRLTVVDSSTAPTAPARERSERVADMPLTSVLSEQQRSVGVSGNRSYVVHPLSVGQMDLADSEEHNPAKSNDVTPSAQGIRADLAMHFKTESWIDVRDATGKALLRSLGIAGSTKEVSGIAPFKILIGYGPGVELELNGEAVEFTAQQSGTVARFILDTK